MRSYLVPLALLFIAFGVPSTAQKSEGSEDSEGEVEVVAVEGAPLRIECSLRVEQRAEWTRDGAALAPRLGLVPREAAARSPGGAVRASLEARAARAAHAGLYRCARSARPVRVRVLPATPATVAATPAGTAS